MTALNTDQKLYGLLKKLSAMEMIKVIFLYCLLHSPILLAVLYSALFL